MMLNTLRRKGTILTVVLAVFALLAIGCANDTNNFDNLEPDPMTQNEPLGF